MNLLDSKVQRELTAMLHGRVCIVGVGNRGRGDDGAGPRVIDAGRKATRGVWIDAGMAPENFLEPIARSNPDTVLIVDAVAFGGFAGECRLMNAAAMEMVVLSTHAGSLGMLSEYLVVRTGASVQVMAIQPARIDVREGLSQPVEKSVHQLASMLSDLLVDHACGKGVRNQ
jgi:hydrogenase maturation protease HycI